jgi:hypothetical protein
MARLVAFFDDERQFLHGADVARTAGLAIEDAFVPYHVHGMEEALGLRRSRLTFVCFVAGLVGGSLALGFQVWTSAVSWPLNIGGKPFASYPAFVPVTFEVTILSAALVSVFAFFARSHLFPGKTVVALPRVTDDRFALVLAEDNLRAREILTRAGATTLEGDVAATGGET